MPADPGNPGYLTGANFNTGIASMYSSSGYIIGYGTPILNGAGSDFAIVSAHALGLRSGGDGSSGAVDAAAGWLRNRPDRCNVATAAFLRIGASAARG